MIPQIVDFSASLSFTFTIYIDLLNRVLNKVTKAFFITLPKVRDKETDIISKKTNHLLMPEM